MGALHNGHISLIQACREMHHLTVCSIFINPTQFNNAIDFEKYPVTIVDDIKKLDLSGCDVLFLPSVAEMYPANEPVITYDLGYIENLLEGKYRPGHFQGVCRIVDKLLKAVTPAAMYLGQKDYQQCIVIKKMMVMKKHDTQLYISTTLRETDGLAMSSRNTRLDKTERIQATYIIECLRKIQESLQPGNLNVIKKEAFDHLLQNGFKVDYVEIADATTLLPVNDWDGKQKIVGLAAAFLGDVRLIDNLLLN